MNTEPSPPKVNFQPKLAGQRPEPPKKPEVDEMDVLLEKLDVALDNPTEFTALTLKEFPRAAKDAIEEIARKEGVTVNNWVTYHLLATLAGYGLDPAPNWRIKPTE